MDVELRLLQQATSDIRDEVRRRDARIEALEDKIRALSSQLGLYRLIALAVFGVLGIGGWSQLQNLRAEVVRKYETALETSGIEETRAELASLRAAAEDEAVEIARIADTLKIRSLEVIADAHSSDRRGRNGRVFGFDAAVMDRYAGGTAWDGKSFLGMNERTGAMRRVCLIRKPPVEGGEATAHGRFDGNAAEPGQWKTGDRVLLQLAAATNAPACRS